MTQLLYAAVMGTNVADGSANKVTQVDLVVRFVTVDAACTCYNHLIESCMLDSPLSEPGVRLE